MALDKAIKSGKEHRKPYTGSKAIDGTCRNHGGCEWCAENRKHKFRDKQEDEIKEWQEEEHEAWNVTDRNCDGYCYIIYAETRGKAIKTALDHTDGAFDDYTFTEIWATRAPSLDEYYHGKTVLEWNDPDDRIIMVREAGFYCSYEMLDADCDCEVCPAKQWCQRYERMKEDKGE